MGLRCLIRIDGEGYIQDVHVAFAAEAQVKREVGKTYHHKVIQARVARAVSVHVNFLKDATASASLGQTEAMEGLLSEAAQHVSDKTRLEVGELDNLAELGDATHAANPA